MDNVKISNGLFSAVQIFAAKDLGLNPKGVLYAEMFFDNYLYPVNYLIFSKHGDAAANLVYKNNLIKEGTIIAEKYVKKWKKIQDKRRV